MVPVGADPDVVADSVAGLAGAARFNISLPRFFLCGWNHGAILSIPPMTPDGPPILGLGKLQSLLNSATPWDGQIDTHFVRRIHNRRLPELDHQG
jgi:hypothetical protein